MSDLAAGSQIADYRIEGVAGRGGMGVVYRAADVVLGRPVALKLIAPALAGDASFRDRFIRESRMAAAIDHPNIVSVFRAGEVDGQLFLAMQYVDGTDLRTLIARSGRLEPAQAARIVAAVGEALDAAHARGLVHRDVKPANVLLGNDGRVYLGDFGLSKDVASVSGLTAAGHMVGTPDYTAPEQIRGERVDARADVYALACVLYEAVTGSVPYPQDGSVAKMYGHLQQPVPSARARAPHLTPALDAVIARAMAKTPEQRPPSAGDLGRAALAAVGEAAPARPERLVARGEAAPAGAAPATVESPTGETQPQPTQAAPPPAPTPAPPAGPGARRGRVIGLVAGALALVAALVVVLVVVAGGDDEPTAGTTAPPTASVPITAPPPPPTAAPPTAPPPPPAVPAHLPAVRDIVADYDAGRRALVTAVATVEQDAAAGAEGIERVLRQRRRLEERVQALPEFPGRESLLLVMQLAITADEAYLRYAETGDRGFLQDGDALSGPVEQAKAAFRSRFNPFLRSVGEAPVPDF